MYTCMPAVVAGPGFRGSVRDSVQKKTDCAMAQGHVYTLKLEGGCFYVGHSKEVETRIAAHFLGNGAGAVWTNLHRPRRVLSVIPGDALLENLTTIALMVEHGHEKVRGGKWCSLEHKCPVAIQKAMVFMRPDEGAAVETSHQDLQKDGGT